MYRRIDDDFLDPRLQPGLPHRRARAALGLPAPAAWCWPCHRHRGGG
ncbi:hypothetical protein [Aeromonas caviae]|nr:hypothetical protein [Aeromonas caviae]